MQKSIKVILLGLIILILSGCVQDRQPKAPQFNSGMKKTKEWIDYNKYAKENNQPILDFVGTTLKFKFKSGKVLNYDHFLPTDPKVVIETKWHNCKISDLYEFKFYMPDGRLYHYEKFSPEKDNDKWTLGRRIYVENVFPAKIQGTWKVEVIANGKTAVIKKFTIGENKQYTKANPNVTVGIFPFWDNQKMSSWKHGWLLGKYLAWATLYNNKNIKVIPSQLILKDISNPNLDYDTFEETIKEDLKNDNEIILPLAKKYNMDYIILGKVLSGYFGGMSVDTTVTTYIVDVKQRKIIDTIETKSSLYRGDFNIATNQRSQGIHPQRLDIYKKVFEDLKTKIQTLSK